MPDGAARAARASTVSPMPIRKLLVANRAEIAARILRTARAMDIATVAVYSDPDAGLPYVRVAGESVRLPGASPRETYLNSAAIIAAARATGADAVHPGYGFLSENAAFAAACSEAGLTFVGPSPATIAAMGSKIAAKELMAAAGVPVLPGVTVPPGRPAGPRAESGLASAAAEIGYPLLVKAAFGGGGRGMRIVTEPAGLPDAIESATREAEAAFGDGTLFIERFIDNPRHIEVQILGDQDGRVVALFERECSIQRRYQKIIEEAPSPAIDDRQRKELYAAAVTAGQAIGYAGAGTVEFVLDGAGGFWFLEVNTRLQVEHPVTELVTGLDLVELQLRIAAGEPIPDSVTAADVTGHAIEARLYAEDVAAGYLPVSGTIEAFEIGPAEGLRVDAGYASGSQVSIHYDSMLAKVIARGPSRDAARRTLAAALDQAVLHGVTTNRDLLLAVLRHEEFVAGRFDTGFLTRHPPAELVPAGSPPPLHLVAAALVGQARRRAGAPVLGAIPSGWRNNPSAPQYATFDGHTVGYRIAGTTVHAEIDGVALPPVVAHSVTPDEADLEVVDPGTGDPDTGTPGRAATETSNPGTGDPRLGGSVTSHPPAGNPRPGGIRRRITVRVAGDVSYIDSALGHSGLTEAARFAEPDAAMAAGSLVAPMPGTVVRIEAVLGYSLVPGQVIVAIEAMKMEHAITAPVAGRLAELRVAVGDQIDAGTVVAMMDEGAQ
jgi:propionyl-CoA carboxylase alpha chain